MTAVATVGKWDLFGDSLPEVKIEVKAIGEMAGKEVTVNHGKTTIASGKLDRQGGRAVASLTASLPQPGMPYRDLIVLIDGAQATLVPLLKDINAIAAKGVYEHLARVRVDVRAIPTLAGKPVLVPERPRDDPYPWRPLDGERARISFAARTPAGPRGDIRSDDGCD